MAKRTIDPTAMGASRQTVDDSMNNGVRAAATPNRTVRLARFDPTMFPIATSMFPCHAARPDTSISGALVPKPMITTPTTIGDTFDSTATRAAPMTN